MEPMDGSSPPRVAGVSRWPNRWISPDVGCVSPSSIFMVVDLPEPLGPRNPYTEPCGTSMSSASTAT